MSLNDRIEDALVQTFQPSLLEVINESRLHADHNPEAALTGETHYRIRIGSPALFAMSRINRHRAINDALKFAFDAGLHALAIEVVEQQ